MAAADLSLREARRAALAAQGFARPRPRKRPDVRHLRQVIDDVGILQLDSVNVLSRAHYLPFFSRLGPYPRHTLDRLCAHGEGTRGGPADPAKRELFEYWGHEASLLPVATQPLMRWRMARVDELAWGSIRRIAAERPGLVEEVLEAVAEEGPVRAGEIAPPRAARSREMWDWSETKKALERLFFTGQITAARRINFERLYDLPERVLPATVLAAPTPSPDEAQRQLLLIAARRLGVATEPDLGDYFRLPRRESRQRLAELVEAGGLMPVRVAGWDEPAYAPPDLEIPRRIGRRRALVSPFDSLVWCRPRTERLWGFRYRIEIYTPAHKRVHGYYVLPFLLGDRLVARVDLKADRAAGALRARGAFLEPGADPAAVAVELAEELRSMATWLELDEVRVERRGDLARPLAAAVAARR